MLHPDRSHFESASESNVARWPSDADGAALRSLEVGGFDFSKPALVEFEVDFESWPPCPEALRLMAREYPSVTVCTTGDERMGYLEFQVYALVSYELVGNVRGYVAELLYPYRGTCSSWRVQGTPPNSW